MVEYCLDTRLFSFRWKTEGSKSNYARKKTSNQVDLDPTSRTIVNHLLQSFKIDSRMRYTSRKKAPEKMDAVGLPLGENT